MNLTFLKKYFGWKTLAVLGLFALAACATSSVGTSGALDCTLILLFAIIAGFFVVFGGNHGMAPTLEAVDTPPPPSTNAAVLVSTGPKRMTQTSKPQTIN